MSIGESKSSPDYLTLTSCLHRKEESDNLKVNHIFDIYKERLIKLKDKTISFGDENLINFILKTANSITIEDVDEIALENKICLAIAIRLESEKYLISKSSEF